MTTTIAVDTSHLVQGQPADAVPDVSLPIADLKGVIEDILNGIQAFELMLFKAATILTISTGVVTATQILHTIAAETGTADDLDTITAMNNKFIIMKADVGDTITLKHGTGNITTMAGADVALSGNKIALLVCLGGQWCLIGDGGSGGGGGGSAFNMVQNQMFS